MSSIPSALPTASRTVAYPRVRRGCRDREAFEQQSLCRKCPSFQHHRRDAAATPRAACGALLRVGGDPSNDGVWYSFAPAGDLLGKIHIPETGRQPVLRRPATQADFSICGSTSLYAVIHECAWRPLGSHDQHRRVNNDLISSGGRPRALIPCRAMGAGYPVTYPALCICASNFVQSAHVYTSRGSGAGHLCPPPCRDPSPPTSRRAQAHRDGARPETAASDSGFLQSSHQRSHARGSARRRRACSSA